jgi:putative transposase
MVLELVSEAVVAGANRSDACAIVGIDRRTEQRWRRAGGGRDGRSDAVHPPPANQLSDLEREAVLEVMESPEYSGVSPKQIVPRLADEGTYLASESTFYRLRAKAAAERPKRRALRRPPERLLTGACQVWSWDITYLRSPIRGAFFYLYLVVDVWSRKIVGWRVENREDMHLSAEMIDTICAEHGIERGSLTLHSDNGGPMRGSTMLATLQQLGIAASFSRPRVSDDNAHAESLFATLKRCTDYPSNGRFSSLRQARTWVEAFVDWYNNQHLHSGIGYVTPNDRHLGNDVAILEARRQLYLEARRRNPSRWTGDIRTWEADDTVWLHRKSNQSTLSENNLRQVA